MFVNIVTMIGCTGQL